MQQPTLIQELSAYTRLVLEPEMAPLAFLPLLLDYRLSAPTVFAELLPPVNDLVAHPLTDIGGGGPITTDLPTDIGAVSVVGTDQPAGAAVATDRSFWFMVFAGHLNATLSYNMSSQVQQARLQMVNGTGGTCAVATLSGADGAVNEQLRIGLRHELQRQPRKWGQRDDIA
ncbi:MAG: hypothetical protein ACJAXA_002562 [Candidatus Aldehydirespiratoraceae bacterium]